MTYGTINTSRLRVMCWNCQGYLWNKGLGLNDVVQGMYIIFLAETWQHDAKPIPKLDGYLIKSI